MNVKLKKSGIDNFFDPRSLGVIGASNAPFNLGATICKCLAKDINYKGKVYAVNRKGENVYDCPGYTAVRDIPGAVDLAVIITPANVVPQFVRECGKKGIRNIIIESAGFSEQGEEGGQFQIELDEAIKRYGIRIIGPNCLGVLDAWSGFCCFYGANALISGNLANPGTVSYVIQSGGIGGLVLGSLQSDLSGVNKMVCIGNKCDVDEADFIEYFNNDNTRVIALYLENIVHGQKFMEAARRTSKPVLVFKTGRSEEGIAAAMSHTAGMANNDEVFDRACRQAGIIRLKTINELHSLPKILTEMPLLAGNRVAVFTNSGAFGTIAADILSDTSLKMASLSSRTREKLAKLSGVFNANNPVDIGPAPKQVYIDIYEILLSAKEVDGLLHTISMWQDYVVEAMVELVQMCKQYDKPAAIYAFNAMSHILSVRAAFKLPLFDTTEEAVRALIVSHEQYRSLRKKEDRSWIKS